MRAQITGNTGTTAEVNADGSLNMQLTGSKLGQTAAKQVLFNALAITDTVVHWYGGGGIGIAIPDWNKYNRRILIVRNSLDQPLKLVIAGNYTGALFNDLMKMASASTTTSQMVTIPVGANVIVAITDADLPILSKLSPRDISMYMNCIVTPTTGSATVELAMWAE